MRDPNFRAGRVRFAGLRRKGVRVPFVSRTLAGANGLTASELYACDIAEARLSSWLLSDGGRRLVRHCAETCGDMWRIPVAGHLGMMLAVLLSRAGVPYGLCYDFTCRRRKKFSPPEWDGGLWSLIDRVGREEGAPKPEAPGKFRAEKAWRVFGLG